MQAPLFTAGLSKWPVMLVDSLIHKELEAAILGATMLRHADPEGSVRKSPQYG